MRRHFAYSFPEHSGAALVVFVCLLCSFQAHSATVLSNLANAPANNLYVNDQDVSGTRYGLNVAAGFTTGSTAMQLESVILNMAASAGGGVFTVSLYSNASGLPGSDLGVTFTGSNNPTAAGQYTYTASTFTLGANTDYWLVASVSHAAPDKTFFWRYTDDTSAAGLPDWSVAGQNAYESFTDGVSSGWALDDGVNIPMFSIQTATSVPEPTRTMLVFLGLGISCCWRRRA